MKQQELVLPNLFVPGAAKSGTSSLHEYLDLHPDIYMVPNKEPHFWTDPCKYGDFASYTRLFTVGKKHKYRGDSSTGYMVFDRFIERVLKYVDNPRFIFILRNPIDRAYSHYWWLRGLGSESRSFQEALETSLGDLPGHDKQLAEGNFKQYYHFGLYGKYLSRFYEAFPRQNIKIITFEKLKEDPKRLINECFRFLNLDEMDVLPDLQSNKTIFIKNGQVYRTLKIAISNLMVVKELVERILRTKIELRLFRRFKESQTIKNFEYPLLSESERAMMRDLYLEDVQLARKLTMCSFEEWVDFDLK